MAMAKAYEATPTGSLRSGDNVTSTFDAIPTLSDDRRTSHNVRRSRWSLGVRRFLQGPRPRAPLTIRHFPWWPLAPVEDGWRTLTMPIAWKEPSLERSNIGYDSDVEHSHVAAAAAEDGGDDNDVDTAPDRWWHGVRADFRLNWLHWLVLALTLIGWTLGFSFLNKSLWYEGSVVTENGIRTDTSFFGCTTTFWLANSDCGIDGEQCAPFSAQLPLDFRCPSSCQTTTLGGQRAVGDRLPAYVPLVVGGGSSANESTPFIYRGDSFVCSAAIHAGVLASSRGGCGRLWLNGAYADYKGVERNGITSTPFDSTFPLSFYFDDSVHDERCEDRRERGYVLDVILLAFVGFVLRPKSIVYFFILVCVGFWHINFISEPRDYPMSVGAIMGDFLPTLFVAYAVWRLTFRFLFPTFLRTLPIEANVWTQGFFWLGVLLNVVFANVPLNRLVASDLADQPGALTSLIVIIVVVVVLAVNQVRVIRKTGYLPKYLTLAIVGGILVGLLAAIPTTGLRLHHYIIALVLLPFCAFKTRLSLIYAAFLLGMFLNGVARWGYDGIVQDVATIRGAGTSGSALPSFALPSNYTGVEPFANASVAIDAANVDSLLASMTGSVHWNAVPSNLSDQWNAFQLLVDDVLRVQANETSFDLAQLAQDYIVVNAADAAAAAAAAAAKTTTALNYTLFPGGGTPANVLQTLVEQPHYVRLAYYNTITGTLGDFTRAATVWFNGSFIEPLPGAT